MPASQPASPRFSARALLRWNAACPDSVFKSVPQRVAATLATLAGDGRRLGVGPRATKVLGDLAERGLIRLGRGRITVLDPAALAAQAGD